MPFHQAITVTYSPWRSVAGVSCRCFRVSRPDAPCFVVIYWSHDVYSFRLGADDLKRAGGFAREALTCHRLGRCKSGAAMIIIFQC